ncbi:hypothetical protein [Erythrobacter sp.]|jgi:hypothetical protein|uniref:hypothetical protein n=1 Tax=Erythrobacter sp. TaxID=1042 RepID=UPI002EB9FCDC|nr:hypothetical protein [Erythrobacter sp.]
MSALDMILKQVSGSPDTVAALAAKVGIDPALAEKGLAALGKAHDEPGDTVALASQKSPLDPAALQAILAQLGGESALGEMTRRVETSDQLSDFASMLDRDGDGSAIDDIAGMAGNFLNRK